MIKLMITQLNNNNIKEDVEKCIQLYHQRRTIALSWYKYYNASLRSFLCKWKVSIHIILKGHFRFVLNHHLA